MRQVIRIDENDKRYEAMVREAKEAMLTLDNTSIVARGVENRKQNIEPIAEIGDIAFYAVHETQGAFVYTNVVTDELIKAATQNTVNGARIKNVELLLSEMMEGGATGMTIDEWYPNPIFPALYALTNEKAMNGAGILFCDEVLHRIWEKMGDYYILPSSVHELLITEATQEELQKDALEAMVREVNATQVSPEERLSNRVFFYDGKLN